MQPCRNSEWVRVLLVLDLSSRSMPRLSPTVPRKVSRAVAKALIRSRRSRRVGSPMRVALTTSTVTSIAAAANGSVIRVVLWAAALKPDSPEEPGRDQRQDADLRDGILI